MPRLFGWLLDTIFNNVRLPNDTLEIYVNDTIFNLTPGIDGFCIPRPILNDFTKKLLKYMRERQLPFDQKFSTIHELYCFYKKANWAPKHIQYFCLYHKDTIGIARKSLKDHERTHALTLLKSHEWIKAADDLLLDKFRVKWFNLSIKILNIPQHKELRDQMGDIWTLIIEGLARIAAVNRARPWNREYVSRIQLRDDKELLDLCKEFRREFGSVENFIKIVDNVNFKKY